MMENPKFDDDELNRLYKEEGERIVSDQLESDQRYAENLQVTQKILSAYYGWGLANETPLGEALGFLDEEFKNDTPKIDKEEIGQARNFLLGLIPEKYSSATELHEVMRDVVEQEKEIAR